MDYDGHLLFEADFTQKKRHKFKCSWASVGMGREGKVAPSTIVSHTFLFSSYFIFGVSVRQLKCEWSIQVHICLLLDLITGQSIPQLCICLKFVLMVPIHILYLQLQGYGWFLFLYSGRGDKCIYKIVEMFEAIKGTLHYTT